MALNCTEPARALDTGVLGLQGVNVLSWGLSEGLWGVLCKNSFLVLSGCGEWELVEKTFRHLKAEHTGGRPSAAAEECRRGLAWVMGQNPKHLPCL